jgi:hypothetical protein
MKAWTGEAETWSFKPETNNRNESHLVSVELGLGLSIFMRIRLEEQCKLMTAVRVDQREND